MTAANIVDTLVFSRDCVKCPEKTPRCKKCPDGKVCVLTAQTCESCPAVKCINDPAKTGLLREQTSTTDRPASDRMGDTKTSSGHKTKVGVIIGVCTAALVLVLVCLGFLWFRRHRQKKGQEDKDGPPTSIKDANNSNTDLPPLSFEPRNSHAAHKHAPISQIPPLPLSRPPHGHDAPPPPTPPHHRPHHHQQHHNKHQSERQKRSQLMMQQNQRHQHTSFHIDDPRNTYTSLKPIQPPPLMTESSMESKGPRSSTSSFKRKRSKPVISAPLPPNKEEELSRPLPPTPPKPPLEETDLPKAPTKGNGRLLEKLNNKPLSTISNRISSHFLHATRDRKSTSAGGDVIGKSYNEVVSVHGDTDNEREEQESIDLRYSFVPQTPPQLPDVGWTDSINSLTWSQIEKRQSLGLGNNKNSRQSSQSQMIPRQNQRLSFLRRDKPRLNNNSQQPQQQRQSTKANSITAPRRLNSLSEPFINNAVQPSTDNHEDSGLRPAENIQGETYEGENILPNISNQGEPILNKQSTPRFTDTITLDSYIPIAYFPETAERIEGEAQAVGESELPEPTTESNYSHDNEITEESALSPAQELQKSQVYNLCSTETIRNLEDIAPSVYSPEPTVSTEHDVASFIERHQQHQPPIFYNKNGEQRGGQNVYNEPEEGSNDSTENLIPELLSRIKHLRETSLASISQTQSQTETPDRITPTRTKSPSSLSSPYRNKFVADLTSDQRHLSVPPPPLARPGYSVVRPLTFTGSYRLEEEIEEDRSAQNEKQHTGQPSIRKQPETIMEMGTLETDHKDVQTEQTLAPQLQQNGDQDHLSQITDFEYPVIFDDNDISFITFHKRNESET